MAFKIAFLFLGCFLMFQSPTFGDALMADPIMQCGKEPVPSVPTNTDLIFKPRKCGSPPMSTDPSKCKNDVANRLNLGGWWRYCRVFWWTCRCRCFFNWAYNCPYNSNPLQCWFWLVCWWYGWI